MAKPSSDRGAGDHKNFLEADGSIFKKSLLLDEDTLRKVGYEGPSFGTENLVEQEDDLGHILTPSQAQDAKQCKFIIPEPGKCVKTKDKKSSQKVFMNICHSDKVPEPPIHFSENQLRNLLQSGEDDAMDDIRIPMSIGAKRIDKDKNGSQCQAYDIIINSDFYKQKILKSDLYWTFLCVVSMEALDEKHKLDLEKNDYIVMKHKACHGKPEPQFVRDKANIREIASDSIVPSASLPSSMGRKPLIQEIDPKGSTIKTATTKAPPPKIECEPRAVPKKSTGEPLFREVSTKVYKQPEDPTAGLPSLEMVMYRDEGSNDSATATVKLPGMKRSDYANVVINCKGDTLEVISVVGKCRIKAPINIISFQSDFDYAANILKLKLKLVPMSEKIVQDWNDHGHNISEFVTGKS